MIGRTLSHYKVLEKIGEGGMGEVYLAKDTKLDREVAVKVLPATFSENKERLARFEREAKLLASLNHPNIAAIHELEESDGVHFLALEFVPGETLAERIKRGPIPVDEALPLFKQIAEALEAAHEKGVIHRDLKPANIKVTPDGKVKVLDFGLAKAMAGETPSQGLSESPTITRDATEAGVLLGTAPYMSPEQARGKPVDKRADIWAFGCCLYEALTGKRVFEGETVTDTLSAVLRTEPLLDLLPAITPPDVRKLLLRCLEKDPKKRLRDAWDVRIEIEEASTAEFVAPAPADELRWRSRPLAFIAAVVLAALVGGLVHWALTFKPPATTLARVSVNLEPGRNFWLRGSDSPIAVSPTGTALVYKATSNGGPAELFLRSLDGFEAKPIPGTDDARNPFFSPDGQWLGFFAHGKLQKVSLEGGAPFTICDNPTEDRGASWGQDNTIIFAPNLGAGLYRVSADGGTPEQLTVPDAAIGETGHSWPRVLPDGITVLFTVNSLKDRSIAALSLPTSELRTILGSASFGQYLPTGHLLYVQSGGLQAIPFDTSRREVTGSPIPILERVYTSRAGYNPFLTVSQNGTLVYVPDRGGNTLVLADRQGRVEHFSERRALHARPPRFSPDGTKIAVAILAEGKEDVWVYDVERGTRTRVTSEGINTFPEWTPDGTRVSFMSNRSGTFGLFVKSADGSSEAEPLVIREATVVGHSWFPDGQKLLFEERKVTGYDIWARSLDGEYTPVIVTRYNERGPILSPNGRYLAYTSDESGQYEIYVQAFPGPRPRWSISIDGGREPMWSRDGRELFFRGPEGLMVAAGSSEPSFIMGRPTLLMKRRHDLLWIEVHPDGRRFLMIQEPMATELHVVLNWFEELKRLVPTN